MNNKNIELEKEDLELDPSRLYDIAKSFRIQILRKENFSLGWWSE